MIFSPVRRRIIIALACLSCWAWGVHGSATPKGADAHAWSPCAAPGAACTTNQRLP